MSGRINFNDIVTTPVDEATAMGVQAAIIDTLANNGYRSIAIGSTGKKKAGDVYSDVDVAVMSKDSNDLYDIVCKVFGNSEHVVNIESLYVVSMPYQYNDGKYVQVDMMCMVDEAYTKFRYHCPDFKANESRYKTGMKIMLANMILNHTPLRYNGIDVTRYTSKLDFSPVGLYRWVVDRTNMKYARLFVTTDVQYIIDACFKDGDRSHFNSVESLWKAIHDGCLFTGGEDHVRQIERNFFVNSWRKGWTSIVPEDFQLQYWTNDQIWDVINNQKVVNRINQIFDRGCEI